MRDDTGSTPTLDVSDVDAIVQMVARGCDPSAEPLAANRKLRLLQDLGSAVSADRWYWGTVVVTENPFQVAPVSLVDGGWASDEERTGFIGVLADPRLNATQQHVMTTAVGPATRTDDGEVLCPRHDWPLFWSRMADAGIAHILMSVSPAGSRMVSAVGMYRLMGRPRFSDRDRLVMHTVLRHVSALHRDSEHVSAQRRVFGLSPREREVLAHLIGGRSRNDIAEQLKLSPHTVGDYIKTIYRHFSVSDRAQLLAQFIAGSDEPA